MPTQHSSNIGPSGPLCPRLRHILTGTFNSNFLHLLRFDSLTKSLTLLLSVPALGPHQYLAALPGDAGKGERIVYATTWAEQSSISAWRVTGLLGNGGMASGEPKVELINSRPIISAGSYLSVREQQAASSTSRAFLYQAGGPTGEVFALDTPSGAIGDRVQDLIFVKDMPDEGPQEGQRGSVAAERIRRDSSVDKTRKGLRYGAHSVEFDDVHSLAYVAHLGRNSILVYSVDPRSGQLTLQSEAHSPEAGDGPRHAVASRDGKWVFAVTEHTSYVDAYRLSPATTTSTPTLRHAQRLTILPPTAEAHSYRGDTIRLSPSGRYLVATTRGGKPEVKGWVRAWKLRQSSDDGDGEVAKGQGPPLDDSWSWACQTPTSGGKANAWEWAAKQPQPQKLNAAAREDGQEKDKNDDDDDLAVLTDDERGYVSVMRFSPSRERSAGIREVARAQLPGGKVDDEDRGGSCDLVEPSAQIPLSAHNGVTSEYEGASHAIWLD
ncbi:3-carboxy-cis,cis-mucoante lactonizing enzyme [Jaminaea rosea]|uniref:3-carboxy-cis,cis-mucoante lactonizing enzyme n=1 Tax=Jaminaea rosea TaxID=1569628 RepID=A0A316UXT4_9BASI|nr:3-carboxy-cis,cis-mucoante lactonizing enzyme [Jaminaea rosea]PWN29598.1 3-carboxy-cis,cis-mucoante lactonizing enzyme [Jaminaea rosea]